MVKYSMCEWVEQPWEVVFIEGRGGGRPALWWVQLAPQGGQMASPFSNAPFASWLSEWSASFGGYGFWMVQREGEWKWRWWWWLSGDGGDGSDGWWLSGPHVSPIFLLYTCIKMQCKITFVKLWNMRRWMMIFFIFLCLQSKYFLWGFYAP